VVVRSGSEGKRLVSARKAVVSNCDLWSTRNIALGLPATPAAVARSAAKDGAQQEAGSPETKTLTAASVPELAAELESRAEGVGRCDSFLHLHLGIDGEGLPTEPSEAFPAQWAVIDSWEDGVDAPRNLVLVSMASLLDPTLAPKGCHVIHAYVPATEPYETWEGLDRRSVEYRKKKAEAAEVLWRAIEKQIPDVRERAKLTLVGTPLTHERFLRRDRGTYGAFVRAGDGQLPGQAASSVEGFYMCGDSTFPGIGVPAVAASGLIAANSIVSVQKHWEMLDRIRL
jgi:phytoene dehydrogenase-like protein